MANNGINLNEFIVERVKEYERKEFNSKKSATVSKRKYNDKHYSALYFLIDRDLVDGFKQRTNELNVSQASVIRVFIENFIEK